MSNRIDKLAGEFLKKVMATDHYQQILGVQKAVNGLAAATRSATNADPKLLNMINALKNKVNQFTNIVSNYGVKASLSAQYRNEFDEKFQQITEYAKSKPHTTSDGSAYALVDQFAQPISGALTNYVPVNMSAPQSTQLAKTQPSKAPAMPQRIEYHLPESGAGSQWSESAPGQENPWPVEVKVPEVSPPAETPKPQNTEDIKFHTSPVPNLPQRVKSPFEEEPGQWKTESRIDQLKKLAGA